jgi:hypothetical protein
VIVLGNIDKLAAHLRRAHRAQATASPIVSAFSRSGHFRCRLGMHFSELDLAQDEGERHGAKRDQRQEADSVHVGGERCLRLELLSDPLGGDGGCDNTMDG